MLAGNDARADLADLSFEIGGIDFELLNLAAVDPKCGCDGLGLIRTVPVQDEPETIDAIDREAVHYVRCMMRTEAGDIVLHQGRRQFWYTHRRRIVRHRWFQS